MNQETKSPLKAAPLRVAGESLDRQIDDVFDNEVVLPYLAASLAVALAAMEWWRYAFDARPSPWMMSAVALSFRGYAV